jgi:type IV pilus assembly protein PilO
MMMDKKRLELLILILLIFFAVNYAVYIFYLQPKFQYYSQAENEYRSMKSKLKLLQEKEAQIEDLKGQAKIYQDKLDALDVIIPRDLNTPQLIYDFYVSTKNFNIQGESINFQLRASEPGSNTAEAENSSSFIELLISLRVFGTRGYIENYIRNLNNITDRKLTVDNIVLSAQEEDTNNERKLSAEINFVQYLEPDDTNRALIRKYEFYDKKIGFDSIADMFK